MIQYKPGVKEIVIARFTHRPDSEQIKEEWKQAKRCEVIDKRFPFDMVRVSMVEKGFEIIARMK